MLEDLQVGGTAALTQKKAGILPYVTLAAGVVTLLVANWFFKL